MLGSGPSSIFYSGCFRTLFDMIDFCFPRLFSVSDQRAARMDGAAGAEGDGQGRKRGEVENRYTGKPQSPFLSSLLCSVIFFSRA